jgi:hypothetical protein
MKVRWCREPLVAFARSGLTLFTDAWHFVGASAALDSAPSVRVSMVTLSSTHFWPLIQRSGWVLPLRQALGLVASVANSEAPFR